MASIKCTNGHTHASVFEVKVCYGLVSRPTAPPPVSYPKGYASVDLITVRQLDYIVNILKGDSTYARKLTKREASDYITRLKEGKAKPVTAPVPTPVVEEEEPVEVSSPKTTKTDMILALIDSVPDGYFAVQRAEGDRVYFVRVNRPKGGKMRGATKVQSQHGPSLETRWVKWPSGSISRYHWQYDIEDVLLMLMADWRGATMRYAEKLKKCGRCNTKLTDPRSRFYGIGPECETKHGWSFWIDEVAEKKGGYWEAQPLHVQEKYRSDDSGL